jgi:hypothetical protein
MVCYFFKVLSGQVLAAQGFRMFGHQMQYCFGSYQVGSDWYITDVAYL